MRLLLTSLICKDHFFPHENAFASHFELYNHVAFRLVVSRSLVTNQDDFDLAWPEPISLTHYNWNYPANLAAGVIR